MGAALWVVLVCVAAPAARAAEDEITAEACLACHGEEVERGDGAKIAPVRADAFGSSVHADLSCVTCHQDAAPIPHEKRPAATTLDTCAICHEDAVADFKRSVHGEVHEAGSRGVGTCAGCHGDIHQVVPHTDERSLVHWRHLAFTCARCHADQSLVEKYRIPVSRPVEAYQQSMHARAVQAGLHGAVCSDCHGSHAIMRSGAPDSTINPFNVPKTCGACHTEVLAQYRESIHGQALARGVRDAPTCTSCHGEHRILGVTEPSSPVFKSNLPSETCGRCHGDARLGERYGLRAANVAAFQNSFHGLALRGGRLTVANCASCHGVHDIHPSSDPRSHVNPGNLAGTCGKCHPGAGKTFQLGSVHGDGNAIGPIAADWIRSAYLWLIALVIGGMVAHNALDLGRKARTPLPPAPELTAPPERMPRALRLQHGLVMVSFPLLVYTGFALTYPESWWARPVLQFETRFALRGLIHRGAALLLVVALVWHAVHLAVSPRLRACFRRMLPSRRDVDVLGGTLAWYVGRRPHPPHAGTFNYAEKAEYWAFLWGMAVMSVTGLLLWFQNVTLRLLPSWVPDVATALHFYEAVLATLAILVWHLYWVIFDPAVYPMDWSWWSGHAPPQRTAERLPEPGHETDDDGGTAPPSSSHS